MENKMDIYEEKKPWGSFRRFIHNIPATVKILTIKPNEELSLQSHQKRSEFWRVIRGEGIFKINDSSIEVKEGDEQFVNVLDKHKIIAKDKELEVLEIGFGDFDEDDIIRYDDKYGRI